MAHLLFAANRYYARGGLDDLIATTIDPPGEEEIFQLVTLQVDNFDSDTELDQASEVRIQVVPVEGGKLGAVRYYQLRFSVSLEDPALKFASIKRYVTNIKSVCGLVPLTQVTHPLENGRVEE